MRYRQLCPAQTRWCREGRVCKMWHRWKIGWSPWDNWHTTTMHPPGWRRCLANTACTDPVYLVQRQRCPVGTACMRTSLALKMCLEDRWCIALHPACLKRNQPGRGCILLLAHLSDHLRMFQGSMLCIGCRWVHHHSHRKQTCLLDMSCRSCTQCLPHKSMALQCSFLDHTMWRTGCTACGR